MAKKKLTNNDPVKLELKEEVKEMVEGVIPKKESISSKFKTLIDYDLVRAAMISSLCEMTPYREGTFSIIKNSDTISYDKSYTMNFNPNMAIDILSFFKNNALRKQLEATPASKHILYGIWTNSLSSGYYRIINVKELDEIMDYIFNLIDTMENVDLQISNLKFLCVLFGKCPNFLFLNDDRRIDNANMSVIDVLNEISVNFANNFPVINRFFRMDELIPHHIIEESNNVGEFLGKMGGAILLCKNRLEKQKLWLLADLQLEFLNNSPALDKKYMTLPMIAFSDKEYYSVSVSDVIDRFELDYKCVKDILALLKRNDYVIHKSSDSFEHLLKSFMYLVYHVYYTSKYDILTQIRSVNTIRYERGDTIPTLMKKYKDEFSINGGIGDPYDIIDKSIDMRYEEVMNTLLSINSSVDFMNIKSTMVTIQIFNDIISLFIKTPFMNKFFTVDKDDIRLIEKLTKIDIFTIRNIEFKKNNNKFYGSKIYIDLNEFNLFYNTYDLNLIKSMIGEKEPKINVHEDIFYDSEEVFEELSYFKCVAESSIVGSLRYNDFSIDSDILSDEKFDSMFLNYIKCLYSLDNDYITLFEIIRLITLTYSINALEDMGFFNTFM